MADLNIQTEADTVPQDETATWEIILWIVGILAIPGVPILMVHFLTPYSGM